MADITSPIIVALDHRSPQEALKFAQQLDPTQCRLKIGTALFTRIGPPIIEKLRKMKFEVFLDLKFHDIPNTVGIACEAAMDLGVWMMNIHAQGGSRMMAIAREYIDKKTGPKPLLIGVTILTSLDANDLKEIGLIPEPAATVQRLAVLAQKAGLDGVVCSPQELKLLRSTLKPNFKLVTPGIHFGDIEANDQKRVATPAQAIRDGADYLVIGRSLTQSTQPLVVLEKILNEIPQS